MFCYIIPIHLRDEVNIFIFIFVFSNLESLNATQEAINWFLVWYKPFVCCPLHLILYFTIHLLWANSVFRYDDLKPPTSPSPSAPTASLLPTPNIDGGSDGGTLSVNNIAQSLTSDEPRDKQHHAGPKPRPLSPFTMWVFPGFPSLSHFSFDTFLWRLSRGGVYQIILLCQAFLNKDK